MDDGGNAVDAAVATAFCIGVVNPASSGLFGGSFMLVRMKNSTGVIEEMIDMREAAPAAANSTMFTSEGTSSTTGGLAVAVPSELKGYYLAWQRHGRLTWSRLVQPSINLAKKGFHVTPYTAHSLRSRWEVYKKQQAFVDVFGGPDGEPLKAGDVAVNVRISETLMDIAEFGPAAIYNEEKAKIIATEIQDQGGVVTAEDFMHAAPVLRTPVKGKAFGLDITTAAPPSSGALNILILNILERMSPPLPASGNLGLHQIVEAMKHAMALRMSLSDPGNSTGIFSGHDLCMEVLDKLVDPSFASEIAEMTLDNTTLDSSEYGGQYSPIDDDGTSHFSILDPDGNAVSFTSTVNSLFGSKFMSDSTGIVFNDEMDDFSTPGKSNAFHLAPAVPNYIEPYKRPISSMSPTIIEREGEVIAVVGASGGPRIITATIQNIIQVFLRGKKPLEALMEPRFHHQFLPNQLDVEAGLSFCADDGHGFGNVLGNPFPDSVVESFVGRGHQVSKKFTTSCNSAFGVSQMIFKDPDTGNIYAASDPRKGGAPSGLEESDGTLPWSFAPGLKQIDD